MSNYTLWYVFSLPTGLQRTEFQNSSAMSLLRLCFRDKSCLGFVATPVKEELGTRNVRYERMSATEGSPNQFLQTVYYCTISLMPQYHHPFEKCCNELRWEDYQVGQD